MSGDEPMTGAQASYLTTLCEETKRPPPGGDLTKAQASKLIDDLKAELGRYGSLRSSGSGLSERHWSGAIR